MAVTHHPTPSCCSRSPWPGPGGSPGCCAAGSAHDRALDDDYRFFFNLAARQLGALVAEARSWEAERVRARKLAELDQAKTVFFSNSAMSSGPRSL